MANDPDHNWPRKPRDPDVVYREAAPASGIIGGVLAAYRVNPVMIAMIALLLSIIAALGYYMMRNDDRIYAYIALRDNREASLYDRLISMAFHCQDKDRDLTAYPFPRFPLQISGREAFKDRVK